MSQVFQRRTRGGPGAASGGGKGGGGETDRSEGQAGLVSFEDHRSAGSGRPGFRREAELARRLGWAFDEARSSAAGARLDARAGLQSGEDSTIGRIALLDGVGPVLLAPGDRG